MTSTHSPKDLPRLYNGQHWEWALRDMNPLQREVFKATYRQTFLEPFLEELRKAGYKKVWIGTSNPYWGDDMFSNMIVAAPSVRVDQVYGGLKLWDVYRTIVGNGYTGNGLGGADQLQGAGWLCLYQGVYDL